MSDERSPSDDELREAYAELGEALQRAVVLSAERVQAAVEDVVTRGRMTRRDAEELASSLISVGRDQAAELRSDLDQLVRSVLGAVDPRPSSRRERGGGESAAHGQPSGTPQSSASAVEPAPAPSAAAATPEAGLDPGALAVGELRKRLDGMTAAELRALREREAAGKARVTALRAIDEQLGG